MGIEQVGWVLLLNNEVVIHVHSVPLIYFVAMVQFIVMIHRCHNGVI